MKTAKKKGELTLIVGGPKTGKSLMGRGLLDNLPDAVLIDDARRGRLTKAEVERQIARHAAVIVTSDDCWILYDLGFTKHRLIHADAAEESSPVYAAVRRCQATLGQIARRRPKQSAVPAAFVLSRRQARQTLEATLAL